MTRSTWTRLVGALGLTGALGGCMLATPPTGLCLLSTCRDFDAQRASMAAQPQASPGRYEAPDFELVYPGQWAPLALASREASGTEQVREAIDQTDENGVMTLRVAVGRPIPLDDGGQTAESMRVFTINRGLDATNTVEVYARVVAVAALQGRPEGAEGPTTLSGQPAHQVVAIGATAGGGPPMRYIVRALMHRGRGYLVLLAVPEALYARASSVYDRLFDGLKLRDADPTYPLPAPRPSPQPTPQPSPGG